MKRKKLSLFSSGKKKKKAKPTAEKEQQNILEIMIAGVIKLSQGESPDTLKTFVGSQVSQYPNLWSESNGLPIGSKSKTQVRTVLENKYTSAFKGVHYINRKCTVTIRDCMQDIQMEPERRESTFADYYCLFFVAKVITSFLRTDVVCLIFEANP